MKNNVYTKLLVFAVIILTFAYCAYFTITEVFFKEAAVKFEDRLSIQEGPELQRITKEALRK